MLSKQRIKSLIEEAIDYEAEDEGGSRWGTPEWDVLATTEAIFADVEKNSEFWSSVSGHEDWEVEESLIYVALDYLGMYGPVFKKEAVK